MEARASHRADPYGRTRASPREVTVAADPYAPRPAETPRRHGGYPVRLSNIPSELTAKDIADAFAEVSKSRIESVDLLRDSIGRPTGEALVAFQALSDAKAVVKRYHKGELNGRRLQAVLEKE